MIVVMENLHKAKFKKSLQNKLKKETQLIKPQRPKIIKKIQMKQRQNKTKYLKILKMRHFLCVE
jgi:hypothetical protein